MDDKHFFVEKISDDLQSDVIKITWSVIFIFPLQYLRLSRDFDSYSNFSEKTRHLFEVFFDIMYNIIRFILSSPKNNEKFRLPEYSSNPKMRI